MRTTILAALLMPSSALAQDVAVYVSWAMADTADDAAALAGLSATIFDGDAAGFRAAAPTADLVVVDAVGPLPPDVRVAVIDAVNAGQPLLFQSENLNNEQAVAAALGVTSVRFSQYYYVTYGATFSTGMPFDPLATSAGVLQNPPLPIGGRGSFLYGGTEVLAYAISGEPTIVTTHGGQVIINGWVSNEYATTDLYRDGHPDGTAAQAIEMQALLFGRGPTSPEFTMSRSCPAATTNVSLTGATPGGALAVVRSRRAGDAVVPGGVCAGARLGLAASSLSIVATITADGSGAFTAAVPVHGCGFLYRVIDLSSCTVSAVAIR